MTRLLSALLVSAVAVTGAAAQSCPSVGELIAAERFNRGPEYREAFFFTGAAARWLSREAGMAFPGTDQVLGISYSDGSLGLFSYVGWPECWRLQVMERRK